MNRTPTASATPAIRKQQLASEPSLLPHSDLAAWTSTVIFAPHPDDESLGCGGLTLHLRQRQLPVTIVFVSDGAMSHPNSRRYDRAARVALRRDEALAACEILGVEAANVRFFQYPDTQVPRLHHPGFEAASERIRQLVTDLEASHILVPWRRDPHCDHRATWELCHAAMADMDPAPTWVEYPIWMWNVDKPEDLPRPDEVIAWRLDVSDVLERKDAAVAAHRSQLMNVIDDDPEGFRLTSGMLANFRRDTELYFELPHKRNKTLGADYFDKVYADTADPWSFETSAYERGKYGHTIEALTRDRYERAFEVGCSIGVLTSLLAERCDELLSIDTAERPLDQARERLARQRHVTFKQASLPDDFPDGDFDLTVLSEVGYYLSETDLERAAKKIRAALRPGGQLLLVHFTPYVPDYPLTGDEVHEFFARFLERGFTRLRADRRERYRLDLYQRAGDVGST